MAREAIEAVQFEMLLEMIEADEALQGGELHLGDIFEAQVIGNEGGDLRGVVIRKAQAAADFFRHFARRLRRGDRIGCGRLARRAE